MRLKYIITYRTIFVLFSFGEGGKKNCTDPHRPCNVLELKERIVNLLSI